MDIYEAWNRIRSGVGIETKSLAKGEGPKDLQTLYSKWLNAIFEIPHPEWYSKHVAVIFIYQGVRYELEADEFDDYVIKDGREGDPGPHWWCVDDARFEVLANRVIYQDLKKLGISDDDILLLGSLD
jgi:hypothetical protein